MTIKREQAAIAAAKVFNTNDGKLLLDYLKSEVFPKTSMPSGAPDGMALAMMMAKHDGQAEMLRNIDKLIKKGQEQ